jgi:beta-lactamase family protein
VTGEPYGVWVKREVVDAAGLTETTPDVPLPAGAKLARGHSGKALLGRRLVFPGDQSTQALAAATGFVSTAADLARFFGQLAPTAETSVLSAESRREMSRRQWKDPWSAFDVGYGLGTMNGAFDGWDWFGHGGGFQGYLTRTATIPAAGLTLSCLTNAADGLSTPWQDGIMAILKRFHDEGAPDPKLQDWTGRWWSVWGASDLVPVGDKVLMAAPGLMNPLMKVGEITVTGADEGRITQAGGFASYGEPVRLIRGADGRVEAVQSAGTRLVREADLAAELTGKYER